MRTTLKTVTKIKEKEKLGNTILPLKERRIFTDILAHYNFINNTLCYNLRKFLQGKCHSY
jgi:hypothetical protein